MVACDLQRADSVQVALLLFSEPGIGDQRFARRGECVHAGLVDDRTDLVQPQRKPRNDSEVPAAAAERPEQVRVFGG